MFVVCAVIINHVEAHDPYMLPFAVKSKEAAFAVILMAAKLRKKDMEGFSDNPYSLPNPHPKKKSYGLKRKSSKENS